MWYGLDPSITRLVCWCTLGSWRQGGFLWLCPAYLNHQAPVSVRDLVSKERGGWLQCQPLISTCAHILMYPPTHIQKDICICPGVCLFVPDCISSAFVGHKQLVVVVPVPVLNVSEPEGGTGYKSNPLSENMASEALPLPIQSVNRNPCQDPQAWRTTWAQGSLGK